MKTTAVLLCAALWVASAAANGVYHQQYNYKASSASYRNNELQHKNDDEEYYSKHGDLEGRTRPKVNSHSQHSEYVNPNSRGGEYGVGTQGAGGQGYGQSSSFGQLNADNQYYGQQQGSSGIGLRNFDSGSQFSASANLRQLTQTLQSSLAREMQEAIYDQYRRTAGYSNAVSQSQMQSDLRALEEELRRNVTRCLEDALRQEYGMQAVKGGATYSIIDGRVQATPNYRQQELAQLTSQLEDQLVRQLQEGVRTQYRTESHSNTQMEVHGTTGTTGSGSHLYPNLPTGPVYQPQPYQPFPNPNQGIKTHHPYQPVVNLPVVHNPDSLTTIGTRVQNDLNEHLNKILEETQRRYFNAYNHNAQDFDVILTRLQDELRANVSIEFDNQIRRTYGESAAYGGSYNRHFNVEDLNNLKRQIESNLLTKLNRDFSSQKQRYFQTHSSSSQNGQLIYDSRPYDVRPGYYPRPSTSDYTFDSAGQQAQMESIQRQLQQQLSMQLQNAISRNQYRQGYSKYSSDYSPQPNYQATLQELTAELNRNLTRQLETSMAQFQNSNRYNSQYESLKNQLQSNLQNQLQQGLSQSWSSHSSWSASASTSAGSGHGGSYRPVRGFGQNLYSAYGAGSGLGNIQQQQLDPDCMQGDDPSTYQQQETKDDLTQQTEDEDLTQQTEDIDFPRTTPRATSLYGRGAHHGSSNGDANTRSYPWRRTPSTATGSASSNLQTYGHNQNNAIGRGQKAADLGQQTVDDDEDLTQQVQAIDEPRRTPRPLFRGRYSSPYSRGSADASTSTSYQNRRLNFGSHSGASAGTPGGTGQQTEDLNQQVQGVDQAPYRGRDSSYTSGSSAYQNRRLNFGSQTGFSGTVAGVAPKAVDEIGQQTEDEDLLQKTEDVDDFRRTTPRPLFGGQSSRVQGGYGGGRSMDTGSHRQVGAYSNYQYRYRHRNDQDQQQTEDVDGDTKVDQLTPITTNNHDSYQTYGHASGSYGSSQYSRRTGYYGQGGYSRPIAGSSTPKPVEVEDDDSDLTQKTEDVEVIGSQQQSTTPRQHLIGVGLSNTANQQTQLGQQEVEDSDLTQQTRVVDLGGINPGYGQLQVGSQTGVGGKITELGQQEVDDSDLTQQTEDVGFGGTQFQSGNQIGQRRTTQKPQYGGFGKNPELGQQEVDDSGLTQQTQHVSFGSPQRPFGQLEIGSQIQRSTTQKPQYGGFGKNPELGQDDSDLTQQSALVTFGRPSKPQHPFGQLGIGSQIQSSSSTTLKPLFGGLGTGGQTPELGQQEVDDSDLTQQTEDVGFGGTQLQSGNQIVRKPQYGGFGRNPEVGQQEVDDSSMTQQTQHVSFGSPQRPFGQLDIGSQIQSSTTQKPHYGGFGRNPELGQQELDDSDLTQQTQQSSLVTFGRPSKPQQPFGQLEIGSQIQSSNTTLKPLVGGFGTGGQTPELGQQEVDDSDLTQQTQVVGFGGSRYPGQFQIGSQIRGSTTPKPQYGSSQFGRQNTELGQQEVDDSDLTQQTQHVSFVAPQFGVGSGSTPKPQYGGFGRNPELGQQEVDDSDLTQQTEVVGFGGAQQPFGPLEVGSHIRSSTTQKPQYGRNPALNQQEVDDSDLTQQTEVVGFGGARGSGQFQVGSQTQLSPAQKPQYPGYTQRTEDVGFGGAQQLGFRPRTTLKPLVLSPERRLDGVGGTQQLLNVEQQSQLGQQEIDDSDFGSATPKPDGFGNQEQSGYSQINAGINRQTGSFGSGSISAQHTTGLGQAQPGNSYNFRPVDQGPQFESHATWKPSTGNQQQTQLTQQTLGSGLEEISSEEPGIHDIGKVRQPQVGANIDNTQALTQQTEDSGFGQLEIGSQSKPKQAPKQPAPNSDIPNPDHDVEPIDDSYKKPNQESENSYNQFSYNHRQQHRTQSGYSHSTQYTHQTELGTDSNPTHDNSESLEEAHRRTQLLIEALRNRASSQNQEAKAQTYSETYSKPSEYSHSSSHVYVPFHSDRQPEIPETKPSSPQHSYSTSYVHYGTPRQVTENVEREEVEEIEPIETHRAHVVQGVKGGRARPRPAPIVPLPPPMAVDEKLREEPKLEIVEPEVFSSTTTEEPGFWGRLGNKIKTKAAAVKDKLG